ncbi:MAG: replicative helicase [Clostridia bacterium]|nr:primary replicative helicase [Clostridiales bacterium]MDK2986487.1 replicative helicase [Clostridia bacterium]
MSVNEKLPPQSNDAEQSVLGSILLDPDAIYHVMEKVKPEDFYRRAHRIIYEVMLDLNEKSEPIDMLTVIEEIRRRGQLEEVGGATYIATLANAVPTAANAPHYAQIVAEKAVLRSLITAASKIVQKGYDGNNEAEQLLDEAEQLIFEISQNRRKAGFSSIKEVLVESFDQLEKLSQHSGEITGIPTFTDLDKLLSGFHNSDLIICAARPGMGKTSFCLNIAARTALREKIPVAIFSLEMSKDQLVQRIWSAEAMVNQHKLRTGKLDEEEWKRLVEAAGPLSNAPIYIDDTPGISVLEVRAKARRLKSEKGLGLIIIDYLQLMQSHRKVDNRQQEITQISMSLKALARELNVPVLALSQLSRAVEQSADKKPNLSHLRESGALEQDSDVVIFIHRPEYYDEDTDKKGVSEIIVAKHRHGPVGTVELAFLAEYTKFVDLAREPLPAG